MSLSIHCPTCHAQFNVAAEQVNIHQGSLRCGDCFTVFNVTDKPLTADNNPSDLAKNSTPPKTKGLVAALKIVCVLLLLLSAIAQTVYYLRSEIAWRYPSSKIYLLHVCEKIGCQLALAQQIDLLLLDDTDLLEDETYLGLIHLSSTIINQAAFNQAYPNIELTLTDIEDQAKFKRLFTPREYLSNPNDLKNGLAAGQAVHLKLSMANPDNGIAGYRVVLIY